MICEEEVEVRGHLIDYESDPPEDLYYGYCCEHLIEHGFCYLCGEFVAGISEFDFAESYGHIKGLCPVCSDNVKADAGEFDEYYP